MRLYLLTIYQLGRSHRFLVLAESLQQAISLVGESCEFLIPGDPHHAGKYTFTLNAEVLPLWSGELGDSARIIGSSPYKDEE